MSDHSYDPGLDDGFVDGELKLEPVSPSGNIRYNFSRNSSPGSQQDSSAHNSDDDENDDKSIISYKERRREAHTQAEQKRRDAIKRGYDQLQDMVPMCHTNDNLSGYKTSKATVLQRSIDYIQYLIQQKKKQEDDIAALRKEVVALQIMRSNYEQIVQAHQSHPNPANSQLTDDMKFEVFKQIMDTLFTSFNNSISVANFAELSGCVFTWLEEYCKPQTLRELVMCILRQMNNQLT
ncbi:hypothetical protein CHUAL_010441 [Chamberlinius hualienensis]